MDQNLKSNKILFSIVIPVYNVENYLIRCLKSIFEQHCDFVFEVIAVDDCSTDNSLAILIKFSNIYSETLVY
jgi:glycosyltransferase involved in cell wall biosynthesis